MTPSRTVLNRMADLFIANTALLAVAAASEVIVSAINQAFTPGLDTVLGDVPVQGAPLSPTHLTVLTDAVSFPYFDELTGERVVSLPFAETSGVIRGGVGTYPFTIHGVRLTSADGLTLLATAKLPVPLPFTQNTDGFVSPRIEFRFPASMIR